MKKIIFCFTICLLLLATGCEGWLDRESKTLITEEQVWNDNKMITALLGQLLQPPYNGHERRNQLA